MISIIVISVASFVVIATVVGFIVLKAKKGNSGPKVGKAKILASSLNNEKLKSDIILNSIEDGVMLVDAEERVQVFNPAASRITGWTQKDAMGISYKSIIQLTNKKNEPYTDANNPFTLSFSQKKTIVDHEAIMRTRNSKSISLDITVTPLLNDEEEVRGVVAIFRDVSDQRQEEAQRAEFISTASHEMRTPVAAIEGYLALAMNDQVSKVDAKAYGFLEKAHDSTKHLGKLFQDLLTSAKAEDGRLTNHPTVIEMGKYLTDLTSDLKFSAEKKGLGVDFMLGAPDSIIDASDTSVMKPLYYVTADPDRLREVITNLFDNAVKYTEKGKITLGLTGDNTVVQIRIADTGPGIPSEDLPHLFQKFYRVDNSSTRTIGGTGLGLFICRKIVEMYQGRIWVESEVEKGSTFYINLPRLTSEQAAANQKKESTQLPTLTPSDTKL